MRCVSCGRMASAEDSQCPYCGCPVLSRPGAGASRELSDNVLELFGEPPAGAEVVPFPGGETPVDGPQPIDYLSESFVWAVVWIPLAWALGVLQIPLAWLALVLALGCDSWMLTSLGVRPWYRQRPPAAPRPRRQPGAPTNRPQRARSVHR